MAEKSKTYKLTETDFRYFRERIYYWKRVLGCTNFKIFVEFKWNENKHNQASFEKWGSSATIKIKLNTVWDIEVTREEIDDCAFHEVFESVYLGELRSMAECTWSEYEVNQACHSVIMKACNTIFKAMRGDNMPCPKGGK